MRYVLKAWFRAILIIKPQCFRADQSWEIDFASSIKKGEVLSIRASATICCSNQLFEQNIQ